MNAVCAALVPLPRRGCSASVVGLLEQDEVDQLEEQIAEERGDDGHVGTKPSFSTITGTRSHESRRRGGGDDHLPRDLAGSSASSGRDPHPAQQLALELVAVGASMS